MNTLLRGALLGLASGMRTFTGFGALTLAAPAGSVRQPDDVLGLLPVKIVVGLAAGQELIMDKLPATPDRRMPIAFAGRVVAGAGSGAVASRRYDVEPDAPQVGTTAGVGAAGAVVATLLCPVGRAALAKKIGADPPVGTLEDLLAVLLSWLAVRR